MHLQKLRPGPRSRCEAQCIEVDEGVRPLATLASEWVVRPVLCVRRAVSAPLAQGVVAVEPLAEAAHSLIQGYCRIIP